MISDAATEIQTLTAEGLYVAARVPELVRVPEQTLLMVDGHGDPNTSPEYKAASKRSTACHTRSNSDSRRSSGFHIE